MKYGVLIGILILGIIMVSGCSNKAPKNPQEDIILTQQPLEPTAKDPDQWLINQTVKSPVSIATSTPSDFLIKLADKYNIPLIVNKKYIEISPFRKIVN